MHGLIFHPGDVNVLEQHLTPNERWFDMTTENNLTRTRSRIVCENKNHLIIHANVNFTHVNMFIDTSCIQQTEIFQFIMTDTLTVLFCMIFH